ncbi:interleukin-15 isoform X1 [Sarcophilus harrisii]|uniref:Interleukin n=1 Tax=Sarcophilus harrisii TaxID=9305 RepID=A0A7N4V2G3_SARHA|nr:interleukin-15 isoform X1 [Sarcophilus harrisii]XP_031797988.1 interleukin-15 isoform X1 [Sarcophilus harrisii]
MLVMSRVPRKTSRAYSQSIGGRKSNLRNTSIQCYLWPILNCHFFSILNESGTYFFILSCISAHLPKTEASHWEDVIVELNHISTITKGRNIDTTLYTESNAHPSCKITMMRCFLLELHVISYECNNTQLYQAVENILVLANDGLSSNRNIKESGCKECEELEEKNVEEFLQSFIRIVQLFIGTS